MAISSAWTRARRRFGWLDHLVRATVRYDVADGGRLAAAVTYYAFFATFSLALLAYASLGFVLDDPAFVTEVERYLAENLPRVDIAVLREARRTAGVIALIGLPISGLFWVDALRSSIRAIWGVNEYPGNFFVRQLVDLLILVGLGLVLTSTLAVAWGTEALLNWLVVDAAGVRGTVARSALSAAGTVIGVGVNTLLAVAVLTGLPRLRMPVRRVLGPAVLVALGLELLKTVGRLYIGRAEANPAYQVVVGAVGLLVFLNVLNQLILFGAALAATSTRGRVIDLDGHKVIGVGPAPLPHSQLRPRLRRRSRVRVIRPSMASAKRSAAASPKPRNRDGSVSSSSTTSGSPPPSGIRSTRA